jgi:dTMP kinase
MPDLTFYIDLDPEIGMSRIEGRTKYDRLDQESKNFHQEVRKGYLEILKMYPNRIVKINGNQSIEKISSEIMSIIKEKI